MSDRPWPWNGEVINESDTDIDIYDYDHDSLCRIPGGSRSDRKGLDVDLVCDRNGQWFKVGANKVTVDKDGKVKFTRVIRRLAAVLPYFRLRQLRTEEIPEKLRKPIVDTA